MRPKLGCVGLGNIGEPVVIHLLQAGYEVLVHDERAEAADMLDAPVSGGVLRAKEGTLSVIVGASGRSSSGAPRS